MSIDLRTFLLVRGFLLKLIKKISILGDTFKYLFLF